MPRSVMTRRTRGREIALQALYILEQNPAVSPREIDQFLERRLREPALRRYAEAVVRGIAENRSQLDSLIGKVAENWSIERMAAIDRNILRLGAYEMLFIHDVPVKVVITEALELAKRYSTSQSSRFVNGILDRLQAEANEARARMSVTTVPSESGPPAEPDANPGAEPA